MEDVYRGVNVDDGHEREVFLTTEIYKILERASTKRKIAKSLLNKKSSCL
jgi:hypothetical protein